jgi:hypothetical protein
LLIIRLAVGAVWYNPKVFGNVWMRSAGLTEEQANSGNMFLIFGLTYLFGLFIGVTLFGMVIHQYGFMQSIQGIPGLGEARSEIQSYFDAYLAEHGGTSVLSSMEHFTEGWQQLLLHYKLSLLEHCSKEEGGSISGDILDIGLSHFY